MNGETSTQTDKTSPESLPELFVTESELTALLRCETALKMRLFGLQRDFANEKDLMVLDAGFSGDLAFWESAIASVELALQDIQSMYSRASVVEGA